MGGPRREIERACDRDKRRAGLSDRARDKEDEEPPWCESESERARETNDETEREDAAAERESERERMEEWSCCRACDERHSNVVRLSVCT